MLYNSLMLLSRCIRCLPYDVVLLIGRVLGNLYYILIKKELGGNIKNKTI